MNVVTMLLIMQGVWWRWYVTLLSIDRPAE